MGWHRLLWNAGEVGPAELSAQQSGDGDLGAVIPPRPTHWTVTLRSWQHKGLLQNGLSSSVTVLHKLLGVLRAVHEELT